MEEDVVSEIKLLSNFCSSNKEHLSVSKRYPYFIEECERIFQSLKVLIESLITGLEQEKEEDMNKLKYEWDNVLSLFKMKKEIDEVDNCASGSCTIIKLGEPHEALSKLSQDEHGSLTIFEMADREDCLSTDV